MSDNRRLEIFHIVVTGQFAASAVAILFWSLYSAGFKWWAIFSLSAQGVVLVSLAVLVYGFAVFRGAVGERTQAEHPLTNSVYYRVFYLAVPLLGGIAGGLDYTVAGGLFEGVRGAALGTVATAFVVWVFVDPIVGVVESTLPESRRLRSERIARQREQRHRGRREKQRQLEILRAEHHAQMEALLPSIERYARRLAELLAESADDPRRGCNEGGAIGLDIWQTGGMQAMRALFQATIADCTDATGGLAAWYLDYWWDGVGGWKSGTPGCRVPSGTGAA